MNLGARWVVWTAFTPIVMLAIAACGNSTEPLPEPTQATTAQAGQPVSEPPLQMFFASREMSVGKNRIAFGLIDNETGPIRNVSGVEVATFLLTESGREGPIETARAVFRQWPGGLGGVYTSQVNFDRAGDWGIGVLVTEPDGSVRTSSARIKVEETSPTPAIGSPAPRSANKTSRNVASLKELTTDPEPDPELYEMTIAEALDTGKPLVVTFATPAYCQTATCGPQVDVVKEAKTRHSGEANFVHVEIYDNPQEIQGDLSNARVSPTLAEWNLTSEPWTFIVNDEGLVYAKFEGFATIEEIEDALSGVLQ